MKKAKEVSDKSTPYRTLGFNMVKAPTKPQDSTKTSKTVAAEDLRVKRGK